MAALELCKIGLPVVNIVGGKLDRDYQTVTGMHAMRFLSDINIDIAFLSPSGLSLKSGFTGGNYSECELKRVVVEKARLVVLLLDASKIDKSLPYTFCHLDQVHIIITDTPLPEDIAEQIHRHGGQIIDVTKENQ
jgi:DeoR/GlpR family transcriptional regulator of sugar metabolism